MEREFYDRLGADLMGRTKDDLAKARDGLTKLKQTLGTLAAKKKKTVHDQRKAGPGALKKAGMRCGRSGSGCSRTMPRGRGSSTRRSRMITSSVARGQPARWYPRKKIFVLLI